MSRKSEVYVTLTNLLLRVTCSLDLLLPTLHIAAFPFPNLVASWSGTSAPTSNSNRLLIHILFPTRLKFNRQVARLVNVHTSTMQMVNSELHIVLFSGVS